MANVIVADNDVLIRGILRSLLASIGQTVFLASGGEEAVDLAISVPARLVVLDLAMPRLNGLQACEKLRKLQGYAATPIVMLTGHDGLRPRLAAKQVGATEFITKPFQPGHLIQSLAAYLDFDVSTQELLAQAAQRARVIAASDPDLQQFRRGGRTNSSHDGPQGLLDEGKAVLDICRTSQAHAASHAPPPRRFTAY